MDIIKILLITLLSAVALGAIIGIVVGKQSVKRALEGPKSILSVKERIICGSMMLTGLICILIGIFVVGRSDNNDEMAGLDIYPDALGDEFGFDGNMFDEDNQTLLFGDDDEEEDAIFAEGEDTDLNASIETGESEDAAEEGDAAFNHTNTNTSVHVFGEDTVVVVD